jgi:uroporphyrinogen decarboxylase
MNQMRQACGEGVVLLGNIPPRDVLARGTPADVRRSVAEMRSSITDKRRVILSCGGGTPPGVSTANLEAFCEAAVLS